MTGYVGRGQDRVIYISPPSLLRQRLWGSTPSGIEIKDNTHSILIHRGRDAIEPDSALPKHHALSEAEDGSYFSVPQHGRMFEHYRSSQGTFRQTVSSVISAAMACFLECFFCKGSRD